MFWMMVLVGLLGSISNEFGQSVDRKYAYAQAYAAKLRELTGVERIYPGSRLD
jgi:hypothetical protein